MIDLTFCTDLQRRVKRMKSLAKQDHGETGKKVLGIANISNNEWERNESGNKSKAKKFTRIKQGA